MLLNEKLFLEYFSPTMPSWLKNFFNSTRDIEDREYAGKRKLNKKSFGNSFYDYMKTTSTEEEPILSTREVGRGAGGSSYNALYEWISKLDVAGAEFLTGDIPKKTTDPRMKEPYQPIFLIEYDGRKQIWAPGKNDLDLCIVPIPRDVKFNSFRNARFSEIQPYITDFVYVDTSKISNDVNQKIAKRINKNNQLDKIFSDTGVGYERNNMRYTSYPFYGETGDKSGYIKNPRVLRDKLEKYRIDRAASKYMEDIENCYNDILNVQQDLNSYIGSHYVDVFSNNAVNPREFTNTVNDIQQRLVDCVEYYNAVLDRSKEIDNATSKEERLNLIKNLVSSTSWERMKSYLKSLKENSKKIKRTLLDW